MKKIIARYFYAPNCTESFATLDRLQRLFRPFEDQVYFEAIDTTKRDIKSDFPWFLHEKDFISTFMGQGNKALIYNKLFIEGKEIKGFPPSKIMIEDTLKELNINLPNEAYQIYYKAKQSDIWKVSLEKLKIKKYNKDLIKDSCLICTKHNPFLNENDYLKENWSKYEMQKVNYILKEINQNNVMGFIAYYEEDPVGFIEAFPLKTAAKLGFPVSNFDLNGVMITCLNIRKEVTGNGIASMLIKEIHEEARINNYQTIEVLAFPDDYHWQPVSIYQKQGYNLIKKLDDLSLMQKNL